MKTPILLLRCNKCGQTQKYQGIVPGVTGKYKKCVYCNNSINVRKCIVQDLGYKI